MGSHRTTLERKGLPFLLNTLLYYCKVSSVFTLSRIIETYSAWVNMRAEEGRRVQVNTTYASHEADILDIVFERSSCSAKTLFSCTNFFHWDSDIAVLVCLLRGLKEVEFKTLCQRSRFLKIWIFAMAGKKYYRYKIMVNLLRSSLHTTFSNTHSKCFPYYILVYLWWSIVCGDK